MQHARLWFWERKLTREMGFWARFLWRRLFAGGWGIDRGSHSGADPPHAIFHSPFHLLQPLFLSFSPKIIPTIPNLRPYSILSFSLSFKIPLNPFLLARWSWELWASEHGWRGLRASVFKNGLFAFEGKRFSSPCHHDSMTSCQLIIPTTNPSQTHPLHAHTPANRCLLE